MSEDLPEEWHHCLLGPNKDFRKFKQLVRSLVDVNDYLINGESNSLNVLHICTALEPEEFAVECVRHLLTKTKADVNCLAKIDCNLVTAAHYAIEWERYRVLEVLIDHRIDLFRCDSYGKTVQEMALELDRKRALILIEKAIKNHHNFSQTESTLVSPIYDFDERSAEESEDQTSDADQTVIYWTDYRDEGNNSSASDSSDNSLVSNISYEKTNSVISSHSDKTEVYLYNDKDRNVILIEERTEPCLQTTGCDDLREDVDSKIAEIERMNSTAIFTELQRYEASASPVTETTKRVYANRLYKYRSGQLASTKVLPLAGYPEELNLLLTGQFPFEEAERLEKEFVETMDKKDLKHNYFTYILMDPDVPEDKQDLVLEANKASQEPTNNANKLNIKLFIMFILSIFYVGKGQGNRVYEHFYEAVESEESKASNKSRKVSQILKIWSSNKGVISLHCFHDVCSEEALAREALMIEALGIKNLTNIKNGQRMPAFKWNRFKNERSRRILGAYLLYKAFQIHLLTGERQIRRPVRQISK